MALLLDQNLPARFVRTLADIFPNSIHVKDIGLAIASDREIWDYARANNFCIVSKDSDFQQLSFTYGPPPKFGWLRSGNASVAAIEQLIRTNSANIRQFLLNQQDAMLIVTAPPHLEVD